MISTIPSEADLQNALIQELAAGRRVSNIPLKLEALAGVEANHFADQRHTRMFFTDPDNISAGVEAAVAQLLPA